MKKHPVSIIEKSFVRSVLALLFCLSASVVSAETTGKDAATSREAAEQKALRDFQQKREKWLAKDKSPEVRDAVEHMKKADLKHPVLKDAVMAARCADVNALLTMRKNISVQTAKTSPVDVGALLMGNNNLGTSLPAQKQPCIQGPAIDPLHTPLVALGLADETYLWEKIPVDWKHPEIMLAACKTPFLVPVRVIHSLGGNVNAKNEHGSTALMVASRRGNLETMKYLVAHGADINAKSEKGVTSLIVAAYNSGNVEIVKYLVEHGADVNAKMEGGLSALMLASGRGKSEMVKYLVEHGADVNAKSVTSMSALFFASKWGYLEIVKCLVEHGADVNAKRSNGLTALDFAQDDKRQDVVDYLRSKGARSGKSWFSR